MCQRFALQQSSYDTFWAYLFLEVHCKFAHKELIRQATMMAYLVALHVTIIFSVSIKIVALVVVVFP